LEATMMIRAALALTGVAGCERLQRRRCADIDGRAQLTHMCKYAATTAVVSGVPLERLRHAVPPFPTRSELWLSLLEQAGL
jgi:hypothetical protein